MTHSFPSYVVLAGILLILFLVARRARFKGEEKEVKGFSKYALARNELSGKGYKMVSEVMQSFLKERIESAEGPARERAEKVLKKLSAFRKVRRGAKKKHGFATLAQEYISVLDEVVGV